MQCGLRALDSFHIVVALGWGKEQLRGQLFVYCDVRLADAAIKIGFDVQPR